MSRIIGLSTRALRDLDAARDWLTQDGAGPRASAKLEAIRAAIRDLVVHPCRFPIQPGTRMRSRLVSGYRIFYRVRPDTGDDDTAGDITVTRVFAPYQDRTSV